MTLLLFLRPYRFYNTGEADPFKKKRHKKLKSPEVEVSAAKVQITAIPKAIPKKLISEDDEFFLIASFDDWD